MLKLLMVENLINIKMLEFIDMNFWMCFFSLIVNYYHANSMKGSESKMHQKNQKIYQPIQYLNHGLLVLKNFVFLFYWFNFLHDRILYIKTL
jgi:hypothetical protein